MAATEESDWSGEVNKVRKILIKPGGGRTDIYLFTAGARNKKIRKAGKNITKIM